MGAVSESVNFMISKLKDDPKMLLIAGGKAQRACEHILGCPLQEWIPES